MKDLAILIPSWNGPKLLDTCLLGIKSNCETNYDIIVILNEVDKDSYAVAKKWGVKIITISENIGTMAVDMAIPLIRGKYKYVANLNNDMIVCPGWDRKLIEYYEKNGCISVSSPAIEYSGGNNRIDTLNDSLMPEFTDSVESVRYFSDAYKNGKYKFPNIISQRHPVIVSAEDFISLGGYSNNWNDLDFFPGYSLDFFFAYRLYYYRYMGKMVSVGDAPVFHDYSATMKKLPVDLQKRNCWELFKKKAGMSIEEFKAIINFNDTIF